MKLPISFYEVGEESTVSAAVVLLSNRYGSEGCFELAR
jgi:hypothetical protein